MCNPTLKGPHSKRLNKLYVLLVLESVCSLFIRQGRMKGVSLKRDHEVLKENSAVRQDLWVCEHRIDSVIWRKKRMKNITRPRALFPLTLREAA